MDENQSRKQDPGATPARASAGDEVAGARPGGRGAGVARETFRGPGRPNRLKKTARPDAGRERETDLFTFMLKRERRRVHLVGFMDDHSRFIVGFGLHARASGAMVLDSFEEAIANFGAPTEIRTPYLARPACPGLPRRHAIRGSELPQRG